MSHTSIIHFGEDGTVTHEDRLQNAWGWAMAVWQTLGQKYLGDPYTVMSDAERLWALADNPRVTFEERILLQLTFDQVVVKATDFECVARAVEKADALLRPDDGTVWHVPAVAQAFRDAPEARALAFNCTSVVADNPLQGKWEGDEAIPYNLDKHEDHWYLDPVKTLAVAWRK